MTILPPPTGPLPPLPDAPDDVGWPTDEWTEADPDADTERLDRLLDQAYADPQPDEHGVGLATVIVQRGRLVAERYGPETDRSSELVSWSMAKSITHALVGILVGDGELDVDQPAAVPEWSAEDDPRREITLDQLLSMSSGLTFVEDYVDATASHCIEMLFGEGHGDMAHYAASLPLQAKPGTLFNYSSGTSNIVARLLADKVGHGESFEAFMQDRLFGPLGMTSARPTMDGAGTFVGSSFVHATARDFARFGLLYLRDGTVDGQPIVPEGWVDHGRTPTAVDDEEGRTYGRHWWVWDPEQGIFSAQGYECQRILCVPTADLVVVRLGKTPVDMAPAVDAWLSELIACF